MPVAQEKGFEASRCGVIVGDATLSLKDHLKDPMVPLLQWMSRQTTSSLLSGAGERLTLTVPFLVVTVRFVGGCQGKMSKGNGRGNLV